MVAANWRPHGATPLQCHADGPYPRGVETFLALPGVGAESKRKIMWDNCRKLYGFAEP